MFRTNRITITFVLSENSYTDKDDQVRIEKIVQKMRNEIESAELYIECCETKFQVQTKKPRLTLEEFKKILETRNLTLGEDQNRPPVFNSTRIQIGSAILTKTDDGTVIIKRIFDGGYKATKERHYDWSIDAMIRDGNPPLWFIYDFSTGHECHRGCSHGGLF